MPLGLRVPRGCGPLHPWNPLHPWHPSTIICSPLHPPHHQGVHVCQSHCHKASLRVAKRVLKSRVVEPKKALKRPREGDIVSPQARK